MDDEKTYAKLIEVEGFKLLNRTLIVRFIDLTTIYEGNRK